MRTDVGRSRIQSFFYKTRMDSNHKLRQRKCAVRFMSAQWSATE